VTATRAPGIASRVPDTGNRAFWALVAVSVLARAVLGYATCCLAWALADGVRDHGAAALWAGRPALWPGAALLAVTAAGLARGAWSLAGSVRHTVGFTAAARRHLAAAPPRLRAAADRAGIGARLAVVGMSSPFALTYGALRPRVLASTGLAETLTGAELAAVLAHEREHLRGRDPLKNVLARAIPARYFYLPALAGLQARFTAGRELAADRAARAACGTAPLAGALLKVADGPAWAAAAPAAAMSTRALLDARITQLETGTEPPLSPAGRVTAGGTAVAAVLLAVAVAWSAVIVAHYMPMCMPR
jgi:Zn-dependent protease with chaperone function